MTELHPFSEHPAAHVIAHGAAGPVTAGQLHADVHRLAEAMPASAYVLNICQDRYRFMAGLGAALLAGRVTLMPSSFTPDMLRRLQAHYPGILCLHDGQPPPIDMAAWALPALASDAAPAMDAPMLDAEQVAAIVFTSGTTGEPTAHAKHWGKLCANGASEAQRLACAGMAIVATVPAQHMYGFESSVLLALHGAASLWRQRPFYPADIQQALLSVPRPRMLVTTPFHLNALLSSGIALPPCDLLLCATAPLSTELAQRAEAALGCPLLEIYGCTESGQVASRRTTEGPTWQLLAGVGMQAEAGAAWVSGGHVEGRVRLSDHIEHLGGAHFRLGQRHADMVNVAGKRASLAALTAQLLTIEGVADGCYFQPDGDATDGVQRLAALVVAPNCDETTLMAALRQRVDAAFLPRPLLKVPRLPRNATGKLAAKDVAALFRTLHPPAPRA
ncbi:MAG: AMP-binding protein [Pseudomonadota bacterium]|nr:AMP-binding protein [Pseudomonadota bacterium]